MNTLPIEKLRALYWAEVHVTEARDAARFLLDSKVTSPTVQQAILAGVVVCYARSFGKNQGMSMVPGKFREFENARLKRIHDILLDVRDTVYAHKDMAREADHLPSSARLIDYRRIGIRISEDGASTWFVNRPILPIERLGDIVELCEFQLERMNAESSKVLTHFTSGKTYDAGEYTLGQNFP